MLFCDYRTVSQLLSTQGIRAFSKITFRPEVCSCGLIICLNQKFNISIYQLIYPGRFLFLLMFSTLSKILTLVIIAKICLWVVLNQHSDISQYLSSTYLKMGAVIGSLPMFLDQRLQALYEQRKWSEVIELTDRILEQKSDYQGSFKFWYYRALGQCAQLQIKSCAKSHRLASLFAGQQYQSSIHKMGQFLNLFNPKTSIQRDQQGIDSLI